MIDRLPQHFYETKEVIRSLCDIIIGMFEKEYFHHGNKGQVTIYHLLFPLVEQIGRSSLTSYEKIIADQTAWGTQLRTILRQLLEVELYEVNPRTDEWSDEVN